MLFSEMFGVERDVEFEVIGYIGRFILRERSDGTERLWWRLKDNKVYVNADLDVLYDIILKAPAGIIHLPPPLTDEQREQLADTDACDRLYWLLTQAERAGVLVEKEDREAVRMAIDILKKG